MSLESHGEDIKCNIFSQEKLKNSFCTSCHDDLSQQSMIVFIKKYRHFKPQKPTGTVLTGVSPTTFTALKADSAWFSFPFK